MHMERFPGYTLVEKRSVPYCRGTGYYLRHDRTGMVVLAVMNDDEDCFFSYVVNTAPTDSTGVFHIIEHTVLSGSRKYPVRDAFTELYRRGCPTFLNAFTGVDKTYYPGSSVVEKDFDGIFSVYTDCIFDPLLRREAFEQEGIRVVGGEYPHFEGVVFSEMQGAMSQHESVVARVSTRSLFPGTCYENESGGDPKEICRLTYDGYLEAYRRCYRPGNMALVLYGNLDLAAKLAFLDENYLKNMTASAPETKPAERIMWTEPRTVRAKSISMDDEHEGKSSVLLSWRLFPATDRKANMILSIVVDILLGSPGAPLYKAILQSRIGEDISTESGMAPDFPDSVFACGFYSVDPGREQEAGDFILSALADIAERGIPHREVEAALRRYEFSLREIQGDNPNGMRVLFRVDKGILLGMNPLDDLFPEEDFKVVRKMMEEDGFVENWIRRNLLDNPNRLLSIVTMDSSVSEEDASRISEVLADRLKEYDPQEEVHLGKYLDGSIMPDDPSSFASVTLNDLKDRSFRPTVGRAGDEVVLLDEYSSGVIYFDASFDVSDFSIGELEDLNFLSRLMSMTGAGDLDVSEFNTELRFNTGGYSFYLESGTTGELEERCFLLVRLKLLKEGAEDALELVRRLLFEIHLDRNDMENALTDIRTEFKSNVLQNAVTYTLSLAQKDLSTSLRIGERLTGISYWERVIEMQKDVEGLADRISRLLPKVLDRDRLSIEITGDEENRDYRAMLGERFASFFERKGGRGPICHESPEKRGGCFYVTETPVNYVSLAAPAPQRDVRSLAIYKIFFSIISQSSVFEKIRGKGGAYGAGASFNTDDDVMLFYSYRDPRLRDSVKDFIASTREEKFTAEKLENAKKKIKSIDLKPLSPSQKALIQMRRRLYLVEDDFRLSFRKALMDVTLSDLEDVRETIACALENGGAVAAIANPRSFTAFDGDEIKTVPV